MVFELERAQGMRDRFERVAERVRKIVHRVDRPFVAGVLMANMPDAVQGRIAKIDIRRRHVDLRAQHVLAVRELAGAHALKQVEVVLDAAVAVRAVPARLG